MRIYNLKITNIDRPIYECIAYDLGNELEDLRKFRIDLEKYTDFIEKERAEQLIITDVSGCNYYWMINTNTYSVDGIEVKKSKMCKMKKTDRAIINDDWRKATEEEVKTKQWYKGTCFNLMNV